MRDRLAVRGHTLSLLDLRVPTASGLRLSAMIDVVRGAAEADARILAIGSSLGGLTVARSAERDARIVGTVLIAPAFRLVSRWRRRVGEVEWARWAREGTLRQDDHSLPGATLDVEFAFMEDVARIDPDGDDTAADAFPDVRVPTAVLHGLRDQVVDPLLSRSFARRRDNVRLLECDDDHQMLASIDMIEREVVAMMERLQPRR